MRWEEIVHTAKILIVDDEEPNLRLMERILSRVGYQRITSTSASGTVVRLYEDTKPDLIILDLHMPPPDGFDVLEQLQLRVPPTTYLPIIVLTGNALPETRLKALVLGAKDFLTKPVDSVEMMLRVRSLLETRFLFLEIAGAHPQGRPEN